MQANEAQRAHIIANLQAQMQGNDDEDGDEDGDMAADYANTIEVLLFCYTTFIADNCLQTLCGNIHKLDTMVYEDVFDMLACSILTTELMYSLT